MGGALLDHLQHAVEHADHGAIRPVGAFGEAAQAVEMPEELVRAVDEVNDHPTNYITSRGALPPPGVRGGSALNAAASSLAAFASKAVSMPTATNRAPIVK